MTEWKNKNFAKSGIAGFAWPIDPQPGDVFVNCNFTQVLPHTKIPDSYTGLTFLRCNMINIDPPADAVLVDSRNDHISYCSNLHPDRLGLPQCEENCSHVIDVDELQLDGEVIRIYRYADRRVD
jgi:hypothetical protein